MPASKPIIIGLDRVPRPWDEVFEGYVPGCTQDARSGYVVRRTYLDGSAHEDAAMYGSDMYGEALEHARRIRAEADTYAVIDGLYHIDGRIVRVAG